MTDWLVAAGPASLDVAEALSRNLGTRLAQLSVTDFPDGESKVRIMEDFDNKNALVVQSLYPPTDKHLLQLLMISHKLSEEGAKVYAAIPYLAYARQDKEFLKGEVVSLGVVSHLLRSVGVKRVITVDIHSAEGLGLFSIPIYSTSAIPLLADYVSKNYKLNHPMAVSPDFGSSSRVEAFAAVLKCEYVSFSKTRDKETGEVVTQEKNLDLVGRDVVIIDDMISSGGSVVKCAQLLKKYGAEKIIAACTHALLVGTAVEKMEEVGIHDIVASNSVPTKYSKVDVAPLIASYVKTL